MPDSAPRLLRLSCLRERREAHAAGLPYVKSAELSKVRITRVKRTEKRAWLADVSAVVLQQALRDLEAAYKNLKDSSGRYFMSFVVDTVPDVLPEVDTEAGIDLGLSTFAVLSDGTRISSPKFLRRAGKNRAKARIKVARQHAKVADRRRDFRHKASIRLIRDNQAVYVEDLAVSGLARTRLAKSVYDAGWSQFVNMLEYKAAKHGRYFGKIGRFEPTSQDCSACGVKDGPKPLHVREWTCKACGTIHDRDDNASKNTLAAGRADRLNASQSAGKTRTKVPAPHEEAGSHPDGQVIVEGTLARQGGKRVNSTVLGFGVPEIAAGGDLRGALTR